MVNLNNSVVWFGIIIKVLFDQEREIRYRKLSEESNDELNYWGYWKLFYYLKPLFMIPNYELESVYDFLCE